MDVASADRFIAKTMNTLGCTGFESGRMSNANAGINRRGGGGKSGKSGGRQSGKRKTVVQRGHPATTVRQTQQRDARYAMTFEAWCGCKLRAAGFKMKHCANALGMDVSAMWRHVSGYTRHWKAQALNGVLPDIPEEWNTRYAEVVDRICNGGGGRRVTPGKKATVDLGLGPNVIPPL